MIRSSRAVEVLTGLQRCGVHIGIKIIGFKPLKDLLLVGETIKHPYFLQPDETVCPSLLDDSADRAHRTSTALAERSTP